MSVNPGGTVRWASPTYKTLTYVAGTVTSLVCNGEKDHYRFGYNGHEKDNEIAGVGNFTTATFWEYSTQTGRRLNIDPVVKYSLSPYSVFANNPIQFADPTGADSAQRATAVSEAHKWADASPGDPHGYSSNGDGKPGSKGNGGPGSAIDCSGLVSKCIVASGMEDPVGKSTGRGVTQIINASTKVDNVNEIQAGNAVTFNTGNPTSHIGLITDVTKDENGNVISYKAIQSGCSTGPKEVQITVNGKGYWDKKVSGFYKWDSPDDNSKSTVANNNTVKQNVTNQSNSASKQMHYVPPPQTYFKQAPPPKFSETLMNSVYPGQRMIGSVLNKIGF